jgi:osmoprotectant transport system permease protein
MLGPLGFENAYALAMRRDRAEMLNIKTINDLVLHAPQLSIGGDYEFFDRPEWAALRDAYGLNFRERRQMDSTFMYGAVASGDVDVITAFSSDGRIARDDLVVLDDPRQALPPYDAVLLLSPKRANDQSLRRALDPLIDAIDVELMREANLRADRDDNKETPAQAARWLWERISGR